MSGEAVTLNGVIAVITEACFSPCHVRKQQVMVTLEQIQAFDGYVEALVAIIDINGVGSTMKVDCRHLAAVLLKNLVSKRPPANNNPMINKTSSVPADCRPLLVSERTALKAFLAGYLHEPECRVALQLALVTAKLARQDGDQWLKEWPELIPSMLTAIQGSSQSSTDTQVCASAQHGTSSHTVEAAPTASTLSTMDYLRAIRGITCLNELLTELSSKASVCTSSAFARNYAALCAQLYPVVSKIWAENMKKLLPMLAKMNAQADASHNTATAYSMSVSGVSPYELESLIVHNILISKVLRIVLEYGFEIICAKNTTFFKTFFQCYLRK